MVVSIILLIMDDVIPYVDTFYLWLMLLACEILILVEVDVNLIV